MPVFEAQTASDGTRSISALARFALRAVGLLIVFLLPWPGLGKLLARAFNAGANALFDGYVFPSQTTVHFDWAPEDIGSTKASAAWHSIVRVQNIQNGAATRFALNTRTLLYLPACVFVALVVASLFWRRPRSRRALAFGVAALSLFLAVAVVLPVAKFLADARIQAIDIQPGVMSFLDAAFSAWVVPPAMGYAVPGIIWGWMMLMSQPR